MKYPNVTVCFAKFFDTRLLEGIFTSSRVATFRLNMHFLNFLACVSEQLRSFVNKSTVELVYYKHLDIPNTSN